MKLNFENQTAKARLHDCDTASQQVRDSHRCGSATSSLTRNMIRSGAYEESFASQPDDLRWNSERIVTSLSETMRRKPDDREIWIFAYGSLMWNPLLSFDRREVATLEGWHRSFCLHMVGGRACPDFPGRMLALEPGGVTHGLAFRIADAARDEELRLVWIREMITGAYQPIWVDMAPMVPWRKCLWRKHDASSRSTCSGWLD